MKLRYSARTDVGQRREINEDSYGPPEIGPPGPAGQLLVVCDGMGGHAAGEIASGMAVDMILRSYYAVSGEDRLAALRASFEEANRRIYKQGHGNMGTTGVAALLHAGGLHIANVGDSRAYVVHSGELTQVSRDHSLVSEQVQAGLMTADQARTSSHRNIITRALGHQPEVQVDLFSLPAHPGDMVVLSSDGMHGLVDDDEILQAVTLLEPEKATEALIRLANERGGIDNITVILARIDDVDHAPAAVAATAELPVAAEDVPTDEIAPLPAAAAPAAAAAAASLPQATALPDERPLSRLGLLLSLATLLVLLAVGGFALLSSGMLAAPLPPDSTVAPPPLATAADPTVLLASPSAAPSPSAADVTPSARSSRTPSAAATGSPRSSPAARTPSAAATKSPRATSSPSRPTLRPLAP